jgi:hypothetical protein
MRNSFGGGRIGVGRYTFPQLLGCQKLGNLLVPLPVREYPETSHCAVRIKQNILWDSEQAEPSGAACSGIATWNQDCGC